MIAIGILGNMESSLMTGGANAALTQLRAWLAQDAVGVGGKLPAERELCELLGVSRGELRKALAVLEKEGALWRQVGKGTFIGLKPVDDTMSLSAAVSRSSPGEVMRARLKFEPMLASEAAVNATAADLDQLNVCVTASREARTWREYETCDNHFHRTVAKAAGNALLLSLFDHMNTVRRAVVWSRGRGVQGPPPVDHHSFTEHDQILAWISERDPQAARAAMRRHLTSVEAALVKLQEAAE